jgi:hypothetical protein
MIPKLNIGRKGRAWSTKEEIHSRYHEICPEKLELFEGKLLWTEEDRLKLIGLLLENVGIDQVIALADLDLWQAALNDAKAASSPR